MKILQSTIEKLLYYLLALVFAAILVLGGLVFRTDQQITKILNNHSDTISRVDQQTLNIEENQKNNSTALEDFIRSGLVCIFTLTPNPTATTAQITAEVDKCFQNTPAVK